MDQLANILKKLGMARIVSLITIALSILAAFGFLMYKANNPEMTLLFSQIDPGEGGRVIEKLRAMKIPHEIKGDGTMIFAPVDQVSRLRMELATNGLPTGGTLGYEIFDKNDSLGSTSSMMNINHIRALEGELAKSIRTIQGIMAARIHLVIPKRELFSKERPEPSASVLIKMYGGSSLNASQVQSIQYLVSSAIPKLTLDRVSIIDDRGTLLAKGSEPGGKRGDYFTQQQEMKNTLEDKISRTIESLLDRSLGYGKSRAQVTLDMDFDQETSQSVIYDPDGQVLRSSNNVSDTSNSKGGDGSSVSIQEALPDENGSGAAGGPQSASKSSQESATYEISNTTKNLIKEVGTIKKMSIAVMVDGMYDKKEDGKEEYKARDEEDIKKLTDLVKTAVGYDAKRGDKVNLVNLQFTRMPELEESTADDTSSLNINKIIEIALTSLVALIALLVVVKPIIQGLFSSKTIATDGAPSDSNSFGDKSRQGVHMQEGQNISGAEFQQPQQIIMQNQQNQPNVQYQGMPGEENSNKNEVGAGPNNEVQESDPINLDKITNKVSNSVTKKVNELVDQYPDETVSVIRNWMYEGK